MAAVIGAVVSALTFLAGFLGLPAAGVESPTAASPTVTATVTVTATAASHAPEPTGSADGQPSNPTSPSERWSGSLLFEQNGSFDLDLTPPTKEGDADVSFYAPTGEKEAEFWNTSMAITPQGKTTDAAECVFLVKTQSKSDIAVPVGRSFCLITTAGRPAIITVKKVDAADVTVNVRVWDKAP